MNLRVSLSRLISFMQGSNVGYWAWRVLLVGTIFCSFVPFLPAMPREGLDPSWAFGINQAVAQGLAFGREMVFPFGPYASIYSRSYLPFTDNLMLVGALYLALLYSIAMLLFVKEARWYWLALISFFLAGMALSRDVLFFSYPLLVGLFCYRSEGARRGLGEKWYPDLMVAALFSPFGLLPLVKGSFLVLCVLVSAVTFALFVIRGRWLSAALIVVSPVLTALICWEISGQSAVDLFRFLFSTVEVARGYAPAMSSSGPIYETLGYVICAGLVFAVVLGEGKSDHILRCYLFLLFAIFLFLSFKGGFVRHDGHALLAGSAILFASLSLVVLRPSRRAVAILPLALLVWGVIAGGRFNLTPAWIAQNAVGTYDRTFKGIRLRLTSEDGLEKEFEGVVSRLKDAADFPSFDGTADIYSFNQAYLISSGIRWNPRPILQSYSAYTPSLMLRNREHLLGAGAPDHVIFRVEPIDGRMPSTMDGASWPALLSRYIPTGFDKNFLFLEKSSSAPAGGLGKVLGAAAYELGQQVPVPVPVSDDAVFAEISVDESYLGTLANILYKPSSLNIEMVLDDGSRKRFRIVPGTVKMGFVISPFIIDSTDFGLMYGDLSTLEGVRVKSFSISPAGGRMFWRNKYNVSFRTLVTPKLDLSTVFDFSDVLSSVAVEDLVAAGKCHGGIASVNGISPVPEKISIYEILRLNGWIAKSISDGLVTEGVVVILKDRQGHRTLFKTKRMKRLDVGQHFHRPSLASSGYSALIDVSNMKGRYTLEIGYRDGPQIKVCPQFQIAVDLNDQEGRGKQ